MTVQTDKLDVTAERAAELIRERKSPFVKEVSVTPSNVVTVAYHSATSERIRHTIASALAPHITRTEN